MNTATERIMIAEIDTTKATRADLLDAMMIVNRIAVQEEGSIEVDQERDPPNDTDQGLEVNSKSESDQNPQQTKEEKVRRHPGHLVEYQAEHLARCIRKVILRIET